MNTEYKRTTLPKVSIITPTKDRCLLLQETVRSVQMQTYSNWELIIVDDGSSDDTADIMSSVCSEDTRIQFMKRVGSHSGAPTCRNQGFQASTGEYIIFLDSDDLLAPYCLEQRIAFSLKNPEYDFVIFPMLIFRNKMGDSKILWNIETSEDDLTRFLSFDVPWQTTCPMWRRDAITRIGLWDEDALTWQDWDFHIRALAHDLRYSKASTPPDCFLRRDAATARISAGDLKDERFLSRLETFEKIYKLLGEKKKLSDRNRRGLAGLFFHHAENAAMRNMPRIAVLFVNSLEKHDLLQPRVLILSKAYLNILLQVRKFNVPIAASLIYRAAQKVLPSHLLNNKTNLFKHSLSASVMKQVTSLIPCTTRKA